MAGVLYSGSGGVHKIQVVVDPGDDNNDDEIIIRLRGELSVDLSLNKLEAVSLIGSLAKALDQTDADA